MNTKLIKSGFLLILLCTVSLCVSQEKPSEEDISKEKYAIYELGGNVYYISINEGIRGKRWSLVNGIKEIAEEHTIIEIIPYTENGYTYGYYVIVER